MRTAAPRCRTSTDSRRSPDRADTGARRPIRSPVGGGRRVDLRQHPEDPAPLAGCLIDRMHHPVPATDDDGAVHGQGRRIEREVTLWVLVPPELLPGGKVDADHLGVDRDFYFTCLGWRLYTPESCRTHETFFAAHSSSSGGSLPQPPLTCNRLESLLWVFLRHRSTLMIFLRQADCVALAARSDVDRSPGPAP